MTTTAAAPPVKLQLDGCAPEPLAAYLKALGVLRLVAEQKDKTARAWWQGCSVFLLQSTLGREELLRLFLEEYRPTPIITPWNGRYKTAVTKGAKDGMDIIRASTDSRLMPYREVIETLSVR